MRYIILFLLFSVRLFGQSGIDPSSLQGTPYQGGVLIGVIPIIDEFTGETVYLYQHSDTSFVRIDSLVYADSLRLYTSDGVFTTYIASGGQDSTVIIGDYGVTAVEGPSNTWTLKADTSEVSTPFDLSLKENPITFTSPFTRSVNTVSIPAATTSVSGHLTSTDWNTFNGKVGNITLSNNLVDFSISGTTTRNINLPFEGSGTGLRLGHLSKLVSNSTVVGYAAGQNLTGTNNTALGREAVKGVVGSTGTNNVGIGLQALLNIGSGVNNVALGSYSLANASSGSNNFGLGESSLLNNTTGNENVAIGRWSLKDNIVGGSNVGIGYFSFRFTNSSSNVGIGSYSGENNTGGSNVFMGTSSGRNSGSASSCVFIGNNAGNVTTRSNTLMIDNSSTTSPLIGGHFDNNRVGINTLITDIGRTLDINGEVRIRDLTTTTPTRLVSADADGVISSLGLSGLSITGGNLTVTATTRDSTIVTGGTGISVVESPLNTFTITNTIRDSTIIIAGDDISVVEGPNNTYIINNTAPDNAIGLSGGGITTVTGTYPNYVISSTEVDGSTTNEKINSLSWNDAQDSLQVVENGVIYRTKITGFGTGNGTVTSVAATAGTGISVTGSPITTSGTLNITNTAPDQVVSLTPSGIVSISGAYPNFTIGATEVGDISAVTVSAPITGGGTSGSVNIGIDTTSSTGVATQYDLSQINQLQTISTSGSAGNITLSDGGGTLNLNVNDADSDPTNELQTISKSGSTVTLSNGGGSFTDAVNDADADPNNELITSVTSGYFGSTPPIPSITITEAGTPRVALVPLFSTSNLSSGTVRGSNGASNSNFLRADGTWAAPTLSEVDGSVTNEGYIGVNAGTPTSSVIRGYNSIGNATGTGVTINTAGNIFISETTSQNGGQITLTGDYGAFGFGVVGNTTTIATDGTGLARIQAGTGITATNSGGTVTISSTAGATNLNFEPKSGTDVTLNSSTGADVIFRDGVGTIANRVASNVLKYDLSPSYTMMSVSSLNQALTTTNTKLALSGSTSTNGGVDVTYDNTNDEIDILTTGTYNIKYTCNCKSNTSAVNVQFDLKENVGLGSLGTITTHYFANTNEFCHNNSQYNYPFTAGDRFSLYARTISGTTTIQDCNIVISATRIK